MCKPTCVRYIPLSVPASIGLMVSYLDRVLAAGTAHGARTDGFLKPHRPAPVNAHAIHELTRMVVEKALGLNAFVQAFGQGKVKYLKDGKEKEGYQVRQNVSIDAVGALRLVQSWIKIGGKNGMNPEDVRAMLDPAGNPRNTIQDAINTAVAMGGNTGFVFDGDNYEPETANEKSSPFSVIIKELIEAGFVVLAIKNAEHAQIPEEAVYIREQLKVSTSFFEKWLPFAEDHPLTFFMALMPADTLKEDVSEKADAFIFWGSTYQGLTKNYRYTPENTDTQGWKEIQLLQSNDGMRSSIRGQGGNTFTAVRLPRP